MRKTLAIALMLTASLGLAACNKKPEDKAQATPNAEQAQQKMNEAQDKVNEAAKENADAAKDQTESNDAAAKEAAPKN